MGCGCKKKKTEEVNQPAQMAATIQVETQPTSGVSLTENQEQLVDTIVEKLSQLDQNS
jgi:hypothetical protein